MKKVLFLLSIAILFLTACSGPVTYTDNISFGEAWAYVAGVTSYWVWVSLSAVLLVAGLYFLIKDYNKKGGTILQVLIGLALLGVFAFALLSKPADVAANTTKEQAARGVYIW